MTYEISPPEALLCKRSVINGYTNDKIELPFVAPKGVLTTQIGVLNILTTTLHERLYRLQDAVQYTNQCFQLSKYGIITRTSILEIVFRGTLQNVNKVLRFLLLID